jgi:hypothetical protein
VLFCKKSLALEGLLRVILFTLLAASLLNAQVNGRLTGSVVDPTGAAVPKATVNLFLHGGKRALLSTLTNNDGAFSIETIRPELYDVTVEAGGFQVVRLDSVKIETARTTDLAPVKLALATTAMSVDVKASAETVQTSSTEVSTTVTSDQLRRLPVGDRNPLLFLSTQAGVGSSQFAVNINGQRESFSTMTLDGVSIQDNYIRDNATEFTPNLLLLDQVKEFTLTTSMSSASSSGGSQINFVTPSGTNQFHGAAYWQNRNNAFAANDFFDNKEGLGLPRLNQNQIGGSVGGPIKRDKLFFYTNYEAVRLRSQTSEDATILTQTARDGIFSYIDTSGHLQQKNILQITGLPIDPTMQALINQIPSPAKINNYRVGDSQPGQLLNTAGYSYFVRSNQDRDHYTGRIDYNLSPKNVIAGSYAYNRNTVDRPDVGVSYNPVSPFYNDDHVKFASLSWRYSPSATLTNEVRGGLNFAPAEFRDSEPLPSSLIGGTDFTPAVAELGFLPQGRNTRTRNIQDNAYWTHGKHTLQFGYFYQGVRIRSYDYFGTVPNYNVGIDSANQQSNLLAPSDLPKVSASDLQNANMLLASLAGLLDNDNVVYNVTSRTSGFVPGAPWVRNFTYDNHAFYIEDKYKARRNLTVTLGLRWDYYTPVNEVNSLELQPTITGNNAVATLLNPNGSLGYSGNSVGNPYYQKNWNNWAPNVGLAWDVFGNGKTSLRAGYGIHYVDDQMVEVTDGFTFNNPGLQAFPGNFDLSGTTSHLPVIPKPAFQVPTSYATQYALNPAVYFTLINPKLKTPYDQQMMFSFQQEFKGTIIELRYLGSHATRLLRGFDFNQENITSNGFLSDFNKARNNGFLAQKLNGVFNPVYNPKIPGSQPLPVFAQLVGAGDLHDATFQTLIQNGEAGELAYQYTVNGLNGNLNFFPNPNALSAVYLDNFSNSEYNSGQIDVRRRLHGGLEFQANYVYSRWLSDAVGLDQLRFEPFLDINNTALERSRPPTDLTHQFKANYAYDLPIGGDHALHLRGKLNQIVSGWTTSGNLSWVSGNPVSVVSGFGTFLREDFSGENTVNTSLTRGQLDGFLQFQMTGNGPYFVPQGTIGADGRGVVPAGQTISTGQLFTNPGPGTIGELQRRQFSGPPVFAMDAALFKATKLGEHASLELRMEALNVFNHAAFAVFNGNLNINSQQYGQITSTAILPRLMQFGARLSF